MADTLVIVESPAKAKTIGKYLGGKYIVKASMGHIRDLPKSQIGVEINKGFEPKYITIRGKGNVLKELKDASRKVGRVFLAADPDREGEAIAWHLARYLEVDESQPCRVVFNEITQQAVKDAFKTPRKINMDLVYAQQARRILDRLVGYKISPLLWKKVKKGLSAGRVQSVAVKLIIDRENEIKAFVPEEYWSITAKLRIRQSEFDAKYYGKYGRDESGRSSSGESGKSGRGDTADARANPENGDNGGKGDHGDKDVKVELRSEAEVKAVLAAIAKAEYRVAGVKEKQRLRHPAPPFITSSLQQEAARKLNFRAAKTMQIAQQLYEGVDIGKEGTVGLITYMRTDSTRLSPVAVEEARQYIAEKFGTAYVPKEPRTFVKKNANTQDAHEAIRPTSVQRHPDQLKGHLSRDQLRLYKLVWERTVASQMASAVLDTVTVDITAADALFRASGSTVKFPGFMKVYVEGNDEEAADDEKLLPPLTRGDALRLVRIDPKQHFTQPPPRYTEARLVRTLEELGIGRPSTYAPTLDTIQKRGYAALEEKKFVPTELGELVIQLMEEFFPEILNTEFTAEMEGSLDRIEEGEQNWVRVLDEFYRQFKQRLEVAEEEMKTVDIKDEVSDEICDKCGRHFVYKMGRFGKFLACSGFPECRNTKPIVKDVGVDCPKCGKGRIIERRSKKGRVFYGCNTYPACDFVSWDKPAAKPCPKCESLLVEKNLRSGKQLRCVHCDYKEEVSEQ